MVDREINRITALRRTRPRPKGSWGFLKIPFFEADPIEWWRTRWRPLMTTASFDHESIQKVCRESPKSCTGRQHERTPCTCRLRRRKHNI